MNGKPGNAAKPTIRLASDRDVAAIHALIVELADATGQRRKLKSTVNDFLTFGFGQRPAYEALIAEGGGRPLGLSLFLYVFSSWRGELGVYLQDLVVAREARGSGLGLALVRQTANMAQRRGATHLRLSVDTANEQAIGFYREAGITLCDDERIFQAEGAAFTQLADT